MIRTIPFVILSVVLVSFNLNAKILVLDFELHDLTLSAGNVAEAERTASLKPLLIEALKNQSNYPINQISKELQRQANQAHGYLFHHPNEVSRLFGSLGNDWVVVGKLHKPSPLFAYIIVTLVPIKHPQASTEFTIEIKGQQQKVTRKGVKKIADRLLMHIRQFELKAN